VGASGAISAIMFASICLFPRLDIGFFGLPFYLPAWLYGLIYILLSIYAIKSKRDNIGHEAHLGGALIGMITAILFEPAALVENYVTILVLTVPTLFFIYMIITRPHLLLIDNYFFNIHKDAYSVDHKYNAERAIRQNEVDRILDKIHKRGMSSLTKKEKEMLKKYSETIR
jgi:hypothetical protein